MAADVAKFVILAMTEVTESRTAETSSGHAMATEQPRSRTGGPSFRQLTFNWTAKNKYTDLKQFELKVSNMFLTKHYDINDAEKVPIKKTLAGDRGPTTVMYTNRQGARIMWYSNRMC